MLSNDIVYGLSLVEIPSLAECAERKVISSEMALSCI